MQCPKCGSDNCQRLEVVYEGGTQQINTTSRTSGVGITGGPSLGGAMAHTSTTGTSQSTLARKAAPPQKKKIGLFVVMIVIGFIFMGLNSIIAKLIGLAVIGYGGYLIYKTSKYNKNEFPVNYNYWLNQWLCHKCGSIFHREL